MKQINNHDKDQPQQSEHIPKVNKTKNIRNYTFEKTLGYGSFGKVKLARHLPTNQLVAIKILEKAKIFETSDIQRVSREIHILKKIRHKNVIQLYQIVQTQKHLFLIMEYCPNGQLYGLLTKKGIFTQEEACKYYQQIINGLEYLHSLKITHRDLKLQNLLLDQNFNIKIADFGLSSTYGQDQLLKSACGSPCYAAPEILIGKKYNPLQIDIWSTGIILFSLLAGQLPFSEQNTNALYKKILTFQYKIPNFLKSFSKQLIKRILINKQQRITLKDIKSSTFFNQIPYKHNKGIKVGYELIPIDYQIVRQMKKIETTEQNIIRTIQYNKHNHYATHYYLLLKKMMREGNPSKSDLNNQSFLFEFQIQFSKKLTKKNTSLNKLNKVIQKAIEQEIFLSQSNIDEKNKPLRLNRHIYLKSKPKLTKTNTEESPLKNASSEEIVPKTNSRKKKLTFSPPMFLESISKEIPHFLKQKNVERKYLPQRKILNLQLIEQKQRSMEIMKASNQKVFLTNLKNRFKING